MRIERIWAMPSRWTFTIKPIADLLKEEMTEGTKFGWLDPFCGKYSPVSSDCKNDINPETEADSHLDAVEFLSQWANHAADGVLYDPPYSITQARKYGRKEYGNKKYWARCRDEVARVVRPGGKVISFGWNSGGMGKCRGFELRRVLLVPHGGGRNDTIVTVEVKAKTGCEPTEDVLKRR